ncbi:MAG: hypothetical protein DMD41_16680 [Gemmatimonadetes bacterium]|nr:MAG: hypothetical protein DMD41_16680 [Gemmatimonadota bacterium]
MSFSKAMAWLRRTAEDGLPCYPLFAGDPYLDSLRRDPQLVAFLARLKLQWETYRRCDQNCSSTATPIRAPPLMPCATDHGR